MNILSVIIINCIMNIMNIIVNIAIIMIIDHVIFIYIMSIVIVDVMGAPASEQCLLSSL